MTPVGWIEMTAPVFLFNFSCLIIFFKIAVPLLSAMVLLIMCDGVFAESVCKSYPFGIIKTVTKIVFTKSSNASRWKAVGRL